MQLSPKQKIAQQILSTHSTIKLGKVTLMYTPRIETEKKDKVCIVVSVSKKITPKAVSRNYNKRVLRAILRENVTKATLYSYNWMWICKEVNITKEMRLGLSEKIKILSS